MQRMRFNQLAAVNTMFKPKRGQSVHTFLQTESKGSAQSDQANDFGKYIGSSVKAKYKGAWIAGVVENAYTNEKGRMRWHVRFKDGHVMQTTESKLKSMLVYERKKKIGRQLDYILISKR